MKNSLKVLSVILLLTMITPAHGMFRGLVALKNGIKPALANLSKHCSRPAVRYAAVATGASLAAYKYSELRQKNCHSYQISDATWEKTWEEAMLSHIRKNLLPELCKYVRSAPSYRYKPIPGGKHAAENAWLISNGSFHDVSEYDKYIKL